MVLGRLICYLVIFFIQVIHGVYSNSYSKIHDEVQLHRESCVDTIQRIYLIDSMLHDTDFRVRDIVSSNAVLNLQQSDDENNNFIDDFRDDAKEYHKKIFPYISLNIKDSVLEEYCSMTASADDCLDQLRADFSELNAETGFEWLYYNFTSEELPESHNYSKEFIFYILVDITFKDDMPLPEEFCEDRYQY